MKRMLPVFALFTSLFCSRQGHCQDSSSRVSVLVSPALFIPVSVAVQAGVQLRLSRRWSVLAEAAFPTFHPKNTDYEKIDFWRAGLEIKFRQKDHRSSKYFSWQNNFLWRKLVDKDQAFYYTRTQTFSYQNATITAPVLSSAIKIGVELPIGKRTFVDGFIGTGLRFIFTDYKSERALVTSTEPQKQDFFKFDDAWLFNYTLTRIHIAGGLRFGIRL